MPPKRQKCRKNASAFPQAISDLQFHIRSGSACIGDPRLQALCQERIDLLRRAADVVRGVQMCGDLLAGQSEGGISGEFKRESIVDGSVTQEDILSKAFGV